MYAYAAMTEMDQRGILAVNLDVERLARYIEALTR
jgi:hypothetical protein